MRDFAYRIPKGEYQMARWEYSKFYSFSSRWTGPDGKVKEMSGNDMTILTELGKDGWEVIAMDTTVYERSRDTIYLLKRPLGEQSVRGSYLRFGTGLSIPPLPT
jgi:hypothetical protein